MKKYIISAVAFLIVGYFLLVLSMLIPNALLQDNVNASAIELNRYGDYPSIFVYGTYLESFCDADYIAVAYNQRSDNPFFNALDAFNYCYDEENVSCRGVKALALASNGEGKNIYEHSHAWHGYRIFLRPLLVKYSIEDIRWIAATIIFLLTTSICLLMYKASGESKSCVPFLFSFLFFSFQLESISICIAIQFLLMLVPCIFILVGCIKEKELPFFFFCMFVTGMCSGFFALCDLPALSIGFPIITMLAFNRKKFDKVNAALRMILFWGIGYIVIPAPKFLINEYFMKLKGASRVITRYTGITDRIGIMDRLTQISWIFGEAFKFNRARSEALIFVMLVITIIVILKKKYKHIVFNDVIAYVFVAMIPLFWIIIMVRASYLIWTVFLFSITIYAVMQYLWKLLHAK